MLRVIMSGDKNVRGEPMGYDLMPMPDGQLPRHFGGERRNARSTTTG